MLKKLPIPLWSILVPIISLLLYLLKPAELGSGLIALVSLFLIGAVLCGVHHAEVVAHKVGEPFGTLVLAIAITIIEVALIISLTSSGGENAATFARDTILAAIMILTAGISGICFLVGGVKHSEQNYNLEGVNKALLTLSAIAILGLILPNFTISVAGPNISRPQLIFISLMILVLYLGFVFMQTIKHRHYFMPESDVAISEDDHKPSNLATILSLVFLLVSLTAVVLNAKAVSPALEDATRAIGAPLSFVGVIVAAVILLPEAIAALKNARANKLQTSLNLALGSALASTGLTIPAVALSSIIMDQPLTLGISPKSMVLLLSSLFLLALSLRTGKITAMQGIVMLVFFAVYIFLSIVS